MMLGWYIFRSMLEATRLLLSDINNIVPNFLRWDNIVHADL